MGLALWPIRANLQMAGLFRGVFVAGTALAKAVAFAVHLENVDVVGQAVEERAELCPKVGDGVIRRLG